MLSGFRRENLEAVMNAGKFSWNNTRGILPVAYRRICNRDTVHCFVRQVAVVLR